MQPFGGQIFAYRAVMKTHGTVDALVKNRPAKQRRAVDIIPIREYLADGDALGIVGAIGDTNRGVLPKRGRRGDQTRAEAQSLNCDRSRISAILVALV